MVDGDRSVSAGEPRPAPADLVAQAQVLVERHPECFWFWRPDARVQSLLQAEAQMTALADARPDVPSGVAFVDDAGQPGWRDDNPSLRIHALSVRGCWPTVRGIDVE